MTESVGPRPSSASFRRCGVPASAREHAAAPHDARRPTPRRDVAGRDRRAARGAASSSRRRRSHRQCQGGGALASRCRRDGSAIGRCEGRAPGRALRGAARRAPLGPGSCRQRQPREPCFVALWLWSSAAASGAPRCCGVRARGARPYQECATSCAPGRCTRCRGTSRLELLLPQTRGSPVATILCLPRGGGLAHTPPRASGPLDSPHSMPQTSAPGPDQRR